MAKRLKWDDLKVGQTIYTQWPRMKEDGSYEIYRRAGEVVEFPTKLDGNGFRRRAGVVLKLENDARLLVDKLDALEAACEPVTAPT